jgi:hypothetical protein
MPRIVYKNLLALIAICLPSVFAIHAQESAYDIMRGYSGQPPSAPLPLTPKAHSYNFSVDFPRRDANQKASPVLRTACERVMGGTSQRLW